MFLRGGGLAIRPRIMGKKGTNTIVVDFSGAQRCSAASRGRLARQVAVQRKREVSPPSTIIEWPVT
jgi:hypothetical protein